MHPSASVNAFFDPTFRTPVEEQIQRVYDAGFRHMDMNFWDWCHDPASPFRGDGWRKWVEGIHEKAALLNVRFTQAHAHVYNFYDHPEDKALHEMYLRSLKGAAMLGIPWVTFHPSFNAEKAASEGRDAVLRDNVEFYRPLVELAGALGTGVALENMAHPDRSFATAGELCQLVDALSDAGPVGVCWDTGHAHIAGARQGDSLRTLGHRLHALHVQDNDGVSDWHMPPFFGTIDWSDLMGGLHDIAYPGDFTFEAHSIVRRVPMAARADAMRLMYVIGRTLVEEY